MSANEPKRRERKKVAAATTKPPTPNGGLTPNVATGERGDKGGNPPTQVLDHENNSGGDDKKGKTKGTEEEPTSTAGRGAGARTTRGDSNGAGGPEDDHSNGELGEGEEEEEVEGTGTVEGRSDDPAQDDEEQELDEDGNPVLAASAEELEEERMDAAVRLIQGLYRVKKAKQTIRELVRANFVKEFDAESECFVYRNKRTGETTFEKPLALGMEDLPTPKIHRAPKGYTVRPSSVRQFAVVICNRNFDSRKLPVIAAATERDFEGLEETLVHPYLCKYRAEDTIFAKDVSLDAFRQHLDTIERLMQGAVAQNKETSFFMYISTHCVNIQHGLYRGNYLAMANSNYGSTDLIRRTTMPMGELARLVKALPAGEKSVALDVCHIERPKSVLLRAKLIYPTSSIYDTLARDSGAVVVGSCKCGLSRQMARRLRKEAQAKTTAGLDGDGHAEVAEAEGEAEGDKDDSKAKKRGIGFGAFRRRGSKVSPEEPGKEGEGEKKTGEGESDCAEKKDGQEGDDAAAADEESIPDSDDEEAIRRKQEREAEAKAKAAKDAEPKVHLEDDGEGGMKVVRNEDGTYTVTDKWDHYRALPGEMKAAYRRRKHAAWDRTIGGVLARRKQKKARKAKVKALLLSNYEHAAYEHDGSVFGSNVVRALKGEAANTKKPRLTVRQLFSYLEHSMKEAMQRPGVKRIQTPILSQHKTDTLANRTTLGTIPSVPPKPSKPFASKVCFTTLMMEWLTPAFTGAAPSEFELQMRGIAKYNKTWKVVGGYATIAQPRFHVPHLTTGIEHQFRVRARNAGGWSDFSEESDLYIPTAAATLSVKDTMKTAASFGIRHLLDTMRKYATSDEAVRLGCWMLSTQAVMEGGFSRGSVGNEIVDVVVSAMKTYPMNASLQAIAMLVLGWACYGHRGTAGYAVRQGAMETVNEALARFPTDSAIHSNATWARSNMEPGDRGLAPAEVKEMIREHNQLLALQYEYF